MLKHVIVEWRLKMTHMALAYTKVHGFGFDRTLCGEDIGHDLRYIAPEGTQVNCMGCIAAEGEELP